MKAKYGSEAGTSPEAKKFLDDSPTFYVVMVNGLPGMAVRGIDKRRDELLKGATLVVHGRDPIVAMDLKAGGNEQKAAAVFVFPKTTPISLDDKEVEFTAKLGLMVVRQKFHLKDMVFNGKLEL